ncbi:monooxygenase [Gordonia insulae]|uniref:monooxygenase n=1 Tax=Gordonia insulae TaxID=2420509 RepID=UPI0038CC010E
MTGAPRTDHGVVVELRVWHVDSIVQAVRRVAGDRRRLRTLPGLLFAKSLGTGSGRTFTMRDADPHRWALLTVWQDGDAAADGANAEVLQSWAANSDEELRVTMRPLTSRGAWSRTDPFGAGRAADRNTWSGPVAAITRARLRPTRMLSFWRAVPPVADALTDASGLRLAVGIGESPIGLQGTFSLWDSTDSLTSFAYRSPAHVSAVRRTKPARWYAEELFARLAVTDVVGTYQGRTP